jgi:hypothetical protein
LPAIPVETCYLFRLKPATVGWSFEKWVNGLVAFAVG